MCIKSNISEERTIYAVQQLIGDAYWVVQRLENPLTGQYTWLAIEFDNESPNGFSFASGETREECEAKTVREIREQVIPYI